MQSAPGGENNSCMKYLDFKVGHKYEVLAKPENQGYYQGDFEPGELVIFRGWEEAIHESYTILRFEEGLAKRTVKFSIGLPEPKWELYFREVKDEG